MNSHQIPQCDFGQAHRKAAAMVKLQTLSEPAMLALGCFDGRERNLSLVPRERAGGGQC